MRTFLVLGMAAACQLFVATLASAQPSVAAGGGHSLMLKADGTVWAAGQNVWGQLGNNTQTTSELPVQVIGLTNVTAIAAGGTHSMALTASGAVYVWGWNSSSQLGDASTNYVETTPKLLSLTNVAAIAAGDYHSIALTTSGDLYTWGGNGVGQLGNGSNTNTSVPQLVASGVQAIGAGIQVTLFVKTDGTVWGMGDNEWGALGDNTQTSRNSPVQFIGVEGAVAVRGGNKHSLILLANGTVMSSGLNQLGQCGFSTNWYRFTAGPIDGLSNITAINAGRDFSLARDANGAVWSWGTNGYSGTLGTPTPPYRSTPEAIPGLANMTHIAAGNWHALALDSSNIVYAWGDNANGELGDGTFAMRNVPVAITEPDFVWRVGTPRLSLGSGTYFDNQAVTVTNATVGSTMHYTQNGNDPTEFDPTVSSGAALTITSSQTLKVKAWKEGSPASAVASAAFVLKVTAPSFSPGPNTYTSAQNIGITSSTPGVAIHYTLDGSQPTASSPFYSSFVLVQHTSTLKAIAFKTGWATSDVQTGFYTMNFGTLGAPTVTPASGTYAGSVTVTMTPSVSGATIRYRTDGGTPDSSSPVYTAPFSLTQAATVRAKAYHPDYTESSETSRSYTIKATTPTLSVASGSYSPGTVVTVATSETTATLRMTLDGTDPTSSSSSVVSGTSLTLGNYTLKVRAFRTGVSESEVATGTYSLTGALGPGAVATGAGHSLLATPDGRVFTFGWNGNGQLGDGTSTDRYLPKLLPTITGIKAVAGGFVHSLAVTTSGQVYGWGSNGNYQLGDGAGSIQWQPWLIPTLANVVAVAAGDNHSLALRSDGKVFGWGYNANGQVGLGSASYITTPTEISGLADVVAIAAGTEHSFAVTSTGQLYAWGLNNHGRLGDGTLNKRTTPVLIGLAHVAAVAAGATHSVAMTRDGSVYSWGGGSAGQLGHSNAPASVATPTVISGLHASDIAAGGDYSAAIGFDGVVVAWGANTWGQIGDTSTTQRNVPVVVSGPPSVSGLAFGYGHSLAATPDGAIWSWGAGYNGRLGDNNGNHRSTPQSIMTGLANWRPAAPTMSASSMLLFEPTTVTVSTSTSGATIRYTTNGAEPTESDSAVPANGEVSLSGTSQFRAKAFVSGRLPSAIGRADYSMASTAPTITPTTGVYTSAQSVAIVAAAGPPATVRYTVDGSLPSTGSTAYSAPFTVNTGMTIKARSFPNDGSAGSAVAMAALAFNHGTLIEPTVAPAGGAYQSAPEVTLSSIAGASIRYTLDGSAPTETSALYAGPIAVPSAGGTLISRAYHVDWSASAARVDTYTIDTTAPTIVADRFPAPLNLWQLTPVIVSFRCDDLGGVASCSAPVVVTDEGTGHLVTGVSTDNAGNQAQLQIMVNVDLTPPMVSLSTPLDGLVTTSSTVQLNGSVVDSLSGLVAVKCNDVDVTAANGDVTCVVNLKPGRNVVALTARDAAGHSTSVAVTVTRTGTVTDYSLTPASRTMLINETATLSFRDNFGLPATNVNWTSTSPGVITLSGDDPPVLTAISAGQATITATKNGFAASAQITVVTGSTLPEGTGRWSFPTQTSTQSRRTAPIYANRVEASGPDLFTVETNFTTNERTVRAVTASGETLWLMTAPGLPLMGDSFGGLIAGVEGEFRCAAYFGEDEFCFKAFMRFAGPSDAPPWRYDSGGYLDRPAQAFDGTLYAIEHYAGADSWGKSIVILDGSTGQVTARIPLARESHRGVCATIFEEEPLTLGPIVSTDGFGYVLVRKRISESREPCGAGTNGTSDESWTLLRLGRSGQLSSTVIHEVHCQTPSCSGLIEPQQLLPDGTGGLLLNVRRFIGASGNEKRLIRLDKDGARSEHVVSLDTRIELVGRAGVAYLKASTGTQAVDVRTWAPLWASSSNLTLVSALPDGGAAAQGTSGELLRIKADGQLGDTWPFGLVDPVQEFGGWVGNTTGTLTALASELGDATAWNATLAPVGGGLSEPRAFGGNSMQSAPTFSFSSADAAAVDVLRFYNPFSIAKNREFGGSICRAGGRFFATVANEGVFSDQVSPSICESMVIPGLTIQPFGRYHTHGTYGDPGLSPQDKVNADLNPGTPWYVAGPCRGIYRYLGPNGTVNSDGTIGNRMSVRTDTLPPISGPPPSCNIQ